jgi:hypothetical protein
MPNPDLFGYCPPNADTAPRHARINAAADAAQKAIAAALDGFIDANALMLGAAPKPGPAQYGAINDACRDFVAEMQAVCPPSADLSAAIRCVRLARMHANHALRMDAPCFEPAEDAKHAQIQLKQARFQGCASVALALPAELPPLT